MKSNQWGPASARRKCVLACLVVLGLAPGCALFQSSSSSSDSSGSFSDSSGSSSDSSKSSSGGDSAAYGNELRAYTLASVRAGEGPEEFKRGVSEVALAQGISDWEALDVTYLAIGAGLADAGVTDATLLEYQTAIASPGTSGFESITRGHEQGIP